MPKDPTLKKTRTLLSPGYHMARDMGADVFSIRVLYFWGLSSELPLRKKLSVTSWEQVGGHLNSWPSTSGARQVKLGHGLPPDMRQMVQNTSRCGLLGELRKGPPFHGSRGYRVTCQLSKGLSRSYRRRNCFFLRESW